MWHRFQDPVDPASASCHFSTLFLPGGGPAPTDPVSMTSATRQKVTVCQDYIGQEQGSPTGGPHTAWELAAPGPPPAPLPTTQGLCSGSRMNPGQGSQSGGKQPYFLIGPGCPSEGTSGWGSAPLVPSQRLQGGPCADGSSGPGGGSQQPGAPAEYFPWGVRGQLAHKHTWSFPGPAMS